MFAVLILSNAIICTFSVWNFFIAQDIPQILQIDAFLIFISASGLAFIFFMIFIEVIRRHSVTCRVWFECVWVGVYFLMQFSGAVVLSTIGPSMMCAPSAPADSCRSTMVLLSFVWINSINLLGYFLLLVISAILYANHDSRIWSRAVRHFVWPDHGFFSATAPAPRSVDSEPTSMSGLNGGRLGLGFGVGKYNNVYNVSKADVGTGGPTTGNKRRSIISIIAPKPRRTAQSNVLGYEREHGPEHIIEPFDAPHPSGGGPGNDINAYDTMAYGNTYGNTYGNYVNNNSDNQTGQGPTAWNVAITRPARAVAAAAGPSSSQMAERTRRRVSRTYPDTSFYATHVQTALAAQPYDAAPPLRVQNPSHPTPSSTPPPVSLPPPPPPPPPVSLKPQRSQKPQNDARRTDTTSSRKTGEKRLIVSPAQAESELEWQQSRSRPRQRAVVSPLQSQPVVPTFPSPVAVTSPRSRPSGPRSRSKSQNGDWTRPPPLDLSGVSSFGERRRG